MWSLRLRYPIAIVFEILSPGATDDMVIKHIINKNSCMRIQLLVSVKDALFYHSRLCSILLASPASIYTIVFSLVQLLFTKYYFHHTSFYFCCIALVNPAYTSAVFFKLIELLCIAYSVLFINPASI